METQGEKSTGPLSTATHIRGEWIELTYKLPDLPDVIRLWNEADRAIHQLVKLLEGRS